MGCDLFSFLSHIAYEEISIHAPVWGATGNMLDMRLDIFISIHAPVWGATDSVVLTTDWK